MSSDEHSHLQDMSNLRFLVIDEADRLISTGNFPQLRQIFSYIQQKSPQPCEESDDDSDDESDSNESDDDDDANRLKHLQGVRGEARVKMLNINILNQIEQQRSDKPQSPLIDDREEEDENDSFEEYNDNLNDENVEVDASIKKYIPRQTFVYSATLTLPSTQTSLKRSKTKSGRSKRKILWRVRLPKY